MQKEKIKIKVKKGDLVIVLCGKDKDKKGKVLRVIPEELKVLVEGINMVKKHQRASQQFQGGIIDKPLAIPLSKVMVMCGRCGKPSRLGRKKAEGKSARFCRKCGEFVDKVK
jgi:large subunit ribosomal protein L24